MSSSVFSNAIYMDDVPKSQWKDYGIGKGYRSICYKTDTERNGKIILFGYDVNGNRQSYVIPWQSYIKYNVKYKTDEQDIYGHYVATKWFKNSYDRNKYIQNANGLNIVECLKPEQEFAHFMWDENTLEPDFNKQPLRIHYFDIETEISDQFMKPSQAENRINMMTIYDSLTEKFYTWSLQHADINFKEEPLCNYPKDKFVFFEFHDNETAMLEHFLSWYEDNYPDVNYGWNTKAYDIPYLTRRIENVLGKAEAKRLSPTGKYFIKDVNHDNERADVAAEIEVNIDGLFVADGLVLYRDKFMISHPDGGYSLDNIGEVEGLGHKIHYEGTLKDLYLKDYQKFYEYNVRDVDLCKKIDDKCKMIQLARQITSFGLTGYGAIYSSISYLIGAVAGFAKTQMGGKIFNSYLAEKHHFDGFEGAYVFPTIAGVYRGGIGCIDFASLYPSNIRAINASPETFVGKILVYLKDEAGNITCNIKDEQRYNPFNNEDSEWGKDDEGHAIRTQINAGDKAIVKLELKLPNGQRKQITNDQLKQLINEKCIWTANNTLFLKHEIKWGVIAKWCEVFYGLRKSTKKKMLKCFHTLHDSTLTLTADEKKKLEDDEENYNTALLGIKAMINSIYGCMGTSFSPIANPDIAQSITRQGRFCNISTSKFIRRQFEKYFGIQSNYPVSISGDTDSCDSLSHLHIKCDNMLQNITFSDLWQDLITKGHESHKYKDYEVIDCNNIEILTYGNKYANLVWLSRHKTTKHVIKITVMSDDNILTDITVTTDHVCMIYDRDKILQNINAKNLKANDYVSVYNPMNNIELIGTLTNIEDLGTTDEYVYDIEVDDDKHAFYANDILVHNSQFINLQCVSDYLKKKRNLPDKIKDWTQKDRNLFWKIVSQFVDKEVNPFVRNLVHDYCHTTQENVLTYELEYMSDVGIYESMKHYATHKIFDEGDPVNKTKYSGIELKKTQVPKEMKAFLSEIYDGVINKDWEEVDYNDYINKLYDNFTKFNIDQVSFWKGYNTERQAAGFLQMQIGTTGIAKACIYYNQILNKLGLGKKYDEIRVGDKVRFCYILDTNRYGINCIAYKPGMWPKEFDEIFKVDYKTMFNKIILDPLKRFRIACKFQDTDPSKQVLQDIFEM